MAIAESKQNGGADGGARGRGALGPGAWEQPKASRTAARMAALLDAGRGARGRGRIRMACARAAWAGRYWTTTVAVDVGVGVAVSAGSTVKL